MSYIGNQVTSNPFIVDVFSGNASQTVFSGLSFAPAGTAAIAVFVGGSYQSPISYSVAGTAITFNSAPASGTNNIQILHLGVGATTIVPSDGSVTTVKLANTGVTANVYGGSDQIPVVTIDAKGRITSAANVSVSIPAGYFTANAIPTMLMLSGM
jgi:hypothetical protein